MLIVMSQYPDRHCSVPRQRHCRQQICFKINKRRNSLSDRPHKISKISVLNFLTQIGSKSLYKCPPNVGGSVAVVDELLEDSCPLVAVVEEHLEDNCPNPPPNIWR